MFQKVVCKNSNIFVDATIWGAWHVIHVILLSDTTFADVQRENTSHYRYDVITFLKNLNNTHSIYSVLIMNLNSDLCSPPTATII